ncbi:hypothetical protein [Francisella persica]|uniref:hypothetical protein n=1 Tax=Francisella persica TaxID=954 RepID=UPI000B0CBBC8|nr:hypothetical protein [Francisella persica]
MVCSSTSVWVQMFGQQQNWTFNNRARNLRSFSQSNVDMYLSSHHYQIICKRFLEKTFLVLGHDVEIVDIAGNATKLLGEYHILCCYS